MKITWKISESDEIAADVENGTNLMEAAILNQVPNIVGECGGNLSCATCHIYITEEWREAVGEPSPFEDDMLDIAEDERLESSRLSCQIIASDELDGLVVNLP
ncbi:MAG: ferredoxin [Hyphomicrobiales bacterium]|nr:MAG: ferredoxin [Hyphomicrobiales bacterium]